MKTTDLHITEQQDTNTSVVFKSRGKDYTKEPLCLSGRGVTSEQSGASANELFG